MNLLRLISLILLIAHVASAPIAAASGRASPSAATAGASVEYDAPSGDGQLIYSGDDHRARAAELRVLVLYGPYEFYTFSSIPAGRRAAGETASRGAPLDRHSEDRWLGVDKAKHVAFSFLWTLGTQYVAVNKGRFSEAQALPISIGTSAAVGLSKEYYDLHMGPTRFFSFKDLVADGVGILLATGVILL